MSLPPFPAPRNPSGGGTTFRGLPRGILALGLGSLFMDTSSELIHSLLPVYMTTVLGASLVTIGVIEGVAEATAAITKVFSGALGDALGRRKLLMLSGYALAALAKPVFPLSGSVGWVFGARFVDRLGKGIRGAPRDALVAEIAPPSARGAAYGLRQALDSVGAFLGPTLAVVSMVWLSGDLRKVMWVAVAPAVLAVVVLAVGVREPERGRAAPRSGTRPILLRAHELPARFWLVVLLGGVFTLARFSEAFLVLRAREAGVALGAVPLVMIAMNIAYAAAAYPAGIAADRIGARKLLLSGLGLLIAADALLAVAVSPPPAFAGAILWGFHLAITQGLMSKLVADVAPAPLLGTAFGIFNLACGTALLLASVIAGALWSALGAPATFLAGAAFAGATALGLLGTRPGSRPVRRQPSS